ncbi:hypothetical protein [Accumulibacter sp.]|uniref:hypothetical protein n=1 Tax=Accumulibacter sp. TaxID=2053492 RepID=UPI0028C4F2C1|nr:hypothetical protein [Accumulibacter sp.]
MLDELGVMHVQAIDDQEYLRRRLANHAFKKLDEALGVDGAFDDLPASGSPRVRQATRS